MIVYDPRLLYPSFFLSSSRFSGVLPSSSVPSSLIESEALLEHEDANIAEVMVMTGIMDLFIALFCLKSKSW